MDPYSVLFDYTASPAYMQNLACALSLQQSPRWTTERGLQDATDSEHLLHAGGMRLPVGPASRQEETEVF